MSIFFCQITDAWVTLYSSHFLKIEKNYEEKIPPPNLMGNELNINSYISIYSFSQLDFFIILFIFLLNLTVTS